MFRVLVCVILSLLVGCTQYVREAAANHRAQVSCYNACKVRAMTCNDLCKEDCAHCTRFNQKQARHGYKNFASETYVKGGIITRELNSFRDPLQCRKPACDCLSDYTVCMQSCKGLVEKEIQVPSACC